MRDTIERAGMRSLAVAFPSTLRTNDFWRQHYPQMVEQAEQYTLAKIWGKAADRPQNGSGEKKPSNFDLAMQPYLADPFRGAVERRWRAPGETAVSMEIKAARYALDAAHLGPDDIDLTLVSSFMADRFGVGDAAFLARELGLRAPAWNFETACSGSLVGLQTASSLVRSGDYRRILVVCSSSNSLQVAENDSVGWFVGDGAGAFVVERSEPGYGVLGYKIINSIETIDMFVIESIPNPSGPGTVLRTKAAPNVNAIARDSAEDYLRKCTDGALEMAGLSRKDIAFWVFNTPNAWYADFCGRVLDISKERYHSMYPRYGNLGAVLMPCTLYHALYERRVRPGDHVMLYSIGSTSTAAGVVMRVGDIAIGPYPHKPGESPAEAEALSPTDPG